MKLADFRQPVFAVIIFSITTLVVTWPLALHVTDRLPIGTEQELTVPLFNIWTLWWTANQAMQGFPSFWDAPIFYPTLGAFSFSEPQPLTGLLATSLWWITDSSAIVYNITLLLFLFLNGLFAFRLARTLQVPFSCSIISGILMIAMPITAKLLGVLPLVPIFGILWALEGFVQFGRDGSAKSTIWAGVGIAVQFFVSQQVTLLFGPFALLAGIFALHQQQFQKRSLIKLSSIGLSVLIICVWFAWTPLESHKSLGFTRTDEVVKALSAQPRDYGTKPYSSLLPFPSRESKEGDTGGLFPGFCLVILSSLGITYGLRDADHQRWIVYFLLVCSLSLILSFGLNISIGDWYPFNILRSLIPGFHEFRSPFRFAILVQMCLCLLSAFGLWRLSQSRKVFKNIVSISTIGLIAILENSAIPQPLQLIPAIEKQEWVTWLRNYEASRVIVHIPFPYGRHVSDYEIETVRMLAQANHKKRLANGYSGYFPPGYSNFQVDMAKNFPSAKLICFLIGELKVDTVVIETSWALEHQSRLQTYSPFTHAIYEDYQVKIFSLPKNDPHCLSDYD